MAPETQTDCLLARVTQHGAGQHTVSLCERLRPTSGVHTVNVLSLCSFRHLIQLMCCHIAGVW